MALPDHHGYVLLISTLSCPWMRPSLGRYKEYSQTSFRRRASEGFWGRATRRGNNNWDRIASVSFRESRVPRWEATGVWQKLKYCGPEGQPLGAIDLHSSSIKHRRNFTVACSALGFESSVRQALDSHLMGGYMAGHPYQPRRRTRKLCEKSALF